MLIIEEKSPVTKKVKENVKKNAKKDVKKNVKKVIDTTKVEENKDAASAKKTKAKPEKAKPYTDGQRKDLIIYMSSWFIYRIFKNFKLFSVNFLFLSNKLNYISSFYLSP